MGWEDGLRGKGRQGGLRGGLERGEFGVVKWIVLWLYNGRHALCAKTKRVWIAWYHI